MIEQDHPFFFLEHLFARQEAVFHFSRYVYTPDSLFDDREFLEVSGADMSVSWLEDALGRLNPNQELAIHSDVLTEGRTLHIPMIDFATEHLTTKELDRLRAFVPSRIFAASAFYRTGRSYHMYSTALLKPSEWRNFLGRLLLVNPKSGSQIVDARWVGHRLIAGYCSLRVSNNSGQYLGMPRRIGIRSIVESCADTFTELATQTD